MNASASMPCLRSRSRSISTVEPLLRNHGDDDEDAEPEVELAEDEEDAGGGARTRCTFSDVIRAMTSRVVLAADCSPLAGSVT